MDDTSKQDDTIKQESASKKEPKDDNFTCNISNSMELRNTLRSGLVEAQGRETEKIPLLVSWPEWLEDGIVCLYVRDFHRMLKKAVSETGMSLVKVIEQSENLPENNSEKKNEKVSVLQNSDETSTDMNT